MKNTSKAAHDSIKPAKAYYHAKVIEGLQKLKVGGTFFEISQAVGLGPDKIWKRISELVKDEKIFDTGITRRLPSGRQGTVWQIVGMTTNGEMPVIESAKNNNKHILPTNQQPFLQL